MDKYYKIENGEFVWFDGILRIDDLQIISAPEEAILAAGWIKYEKPQPTEYELMLEAKRKKCDEIKSYDKSGDVNIFFVNNEPIWLDKATRSGLIFRLESERDLGKVETTLWYDITEFKLPIDYAIQMLKTIEVYASECYDNTQKHLANIHKLETIEEIETYDYTIGYPEKLNF
jgi:hypothetical protein